MLSHGDGRNADDRQHHGQQFGRGDGFLQNYPRQNNDPGRRRIEQNGRQRRPAVFDSHLVEKIKQRNTADSKRQDIRNIFSIQTYLMPDDGMTAKEDPGQQRPPESNLHGRNALLKRQPGKRADHSPQHRRGNNKCISPENHLTPDPFADEYNGFWFNPGSGKYQTQTATYSVDSREKAWHLNKTCPLNDIFSVKVYP